MNVVQIDVCPCLIEYDSDKIMDDFTHWILELFVHLLYYRQHVF